LALVRKAYSTSLLPMSDEPVRCCSAYSTYPVRGEDGLVEEVRFEMRRACSGDLLPEKAQECVEVGVGESQLIRLCCARRFVDASRLARFRVGLRDVSPKQYSPFGREGSGALPGRVARRRRRGVESDERPDG
jgi:hypothetical protein